MKSLLALAAVIPLLAAAPALAQSPAATPAKATSAQTRFIDHAARDSNAEIELGKMAEQKAASPAVKALAQRLVADHSKANQQLSQIAQQAGVQPPSGIGKKDQALHARLEKLEGGAFDRAYVAAQVKDHENAVRYFKHQASVLKDPQLKSFAEQTAPVLEEHLKMAQQTQSELSASGSSTPPSPPASAAIPSGNRGR